MFLKVELIDQFVVLRDAKKKFEYPIIWLRDNCQCEKCFDAKTHTRIIDWDTFDFKVLPTSIEVNYILYLVKEKPD